MKSKGAIRTLLRTWIVGLMLLLGLYGCQGGGTGNPSAPDLTFKGQAGRNSSGTTSEDTEGSAIDRPQYPQDTVVIVAIGDSITYGQGAWEGGYPTRLESRLLADGHNVVVLNKGIRGEQSAETDARFLKEIAVADIVLLMIGINDVVNPGVCESPFSCHVSNHIRSMMDKALISKVIPVVSTITPARVGDDYDWANPQIRLVNTDILSNAFEQNVVTVDNYLAVTINGGSALYDDRIHFNSWGYDVIAEQWYTAIEQNKLIQQALEQKK
jgi:lysophospholipase L1-like esterase